MIGSSVSFSPPELGGVPVRAGWSEEGAAVTSGWSEEGAAVTSGWSEEGETWRSFRPPLTPPNSGGEEVTLRAEDSAEVFSFLLPHSSFLEKTQIV
jgi:hypothetical protein